MVVSGKRRAPLILASTSPRRIELLRQLGLEILVAESKVEEIREAVIPVHELVERNALAKALDVSSRFSEGVVIAADTIVACGGRLFGKPDSLRDARATLRELAGKTHQVCSGVVVMRIEDQATKLGHAITHVTFRPLTDEQITRYLDMIDPLDKAGAYAIQGAGGIIVEKISGCYYNVVGLPLSLLDNLLAHFGIQLL